MITEHVIDFEGEGIAEYMTLGVGLAPNQATRVSIMDSKRKDIGCVHVGVQGGEVVVQVEFIRGSLNIDYREPVQVERKVTESFVEPFGRRRGR